MTETLITTVPQIDGGTRYVYAQDAAHAARARRILTDDHAMIDYLDGVDGIAITTQDA